MGESIKQNAPPLIDIETANKAIQTIQKQYSQVRVIHFKFHLKETHWTWLRIKKNNNNKYFA